MYRQKRDTKVDYTSHFTLSAAESQRQRLFATRLFLREEKSALFSLSNDYNVRKLRWNSSPPDDGAERGPRGSDESCISGVEM